MAGGSINCGTFSGEDKSGSAFQDVIDAIQNAAKGEDIEVVEAIQASLDEASEYILIPEHQAQKLLSLLVAYDEMNEKGAALFQELGKRYGVFLLTIDAKASYDIRFEWDDLTRWEISKLRGGSGLPRDP